LQGLRRRPSEERAPHRGRGPATGSSGNDRAGAQRPGIGHNGPFAETKEQLAGFYLIDAKDLNEAIQLASKIPPARVGSIEVRPTRELSV